MAVFLLFALMSWIAYLLLVAAERKEAPSTSPYELAILDYIDIRIDPIVYRASAVAVLFIVVFLVSLIALSQAYDESTGLYTFYSFVSSETFSQGILGTIFGVVLASWMVRLYRMRRNQPLAVTQKMEGVALIFLFIIGTSTLSIDDLIRSIKFGANGLSFDLPDRAAVDSLIAGNATAAPSLINPSADGGDGDGNGDGRNGRQVGDRLTTQWGPLVLTALGEFMMRDHEKMRSEPFERQHLVQAEFDNLERAASNYGNRFRATAECLSSTVDVTGDTTYVNELLRGIRPLVRQMHLQSLGMLRATFDTGSYAGMRRTEEEMLKRIGILQGELVGHYAEIKSGIAAIRNAEKENYSHDDRQLNCDDLQKEVAARPLRQEEPGKEAIIAVDGVERRPYTSILYSALLQLDGQELAAVEALDDWLKVARPSPQSWYYTRVLYAQFTLLESYFRRAGPQSDIMNEFFLEKTQDYINSLEIKAGALADYAAIFEAQARNFVGENFEYDDRPAGQCELQGAAEEQLSKIRSAYALMNAKAVFARRAIEHSRLADNYLPLAKQYAREIVNANTSCLLPLVGSETTLYKIEAENLLIYARLMVAQAAARRPFGEDYRKLTARDLTTAQNALSLARSRIDSFGNPQRRRKIEAVRASQIEVDNPHRVLWDELTALLATNEKQLARFR